MTMEKRGATTERDIRNLIKMADEEEMTLIINMDGQLKYASGKHKPGIAVLATGDRALILRRLMQEAGIT